MGEKMEGKAASEFVKVTDNFIVEQHLEHPNDRYFEQVIYFFCNLKLNILCTPL
jgi:hypothetical protein